MTIGIVGVGLIGGSMAITLREKGFADRILGSGRSENSLNKALALGLIDEKKELNDLVKEADLIILAVPVDALKEMLPHVLDSVNDKQVVIDVGSTKEMFLQIIKGHPKRRRFVATHPMAGTEYSGPEAAVKDLFEGKCTVFCDVEDSEGDAVELVKKMYDTLGMRIVYMDSVSHDLHTAYVSHISHITSFALALTVLEKEKEEEAIFELASGGFESTVRLAKSSPDMWIPVFKQNRHNVLDVLYELIYQLKHIKQLLVDEDYEEFYKLIQKANEIKKILK
ncbi:MAG: prephenate dehydrogenase [Chitinophagaceae bacterium]